MLLKETDKQTREKDEEIEKLRSRIVWLERQQSELFEERIKRETLIKSPPESVPSAVKTDPNDLKRVSNLELFQRCVQTSCCSRLKVKNAWRMSKSGSR